MGGFSAQTQEPQTSGGGKTGPVASAVDQVSQRPDGLDQNAINADPQGFAKWQQQKSQQPQPYQSGGGKAGSFSSVAQPTYDQQSPDNGSQQGYTPRPMGKGGAQTNSATSGQPRMGQQNQYSNTVGQWDNTQIQPAQQHGKGKGG